MLEAKKKTTTTNNLSGLSYAKLNVRILSKTIAENQQPHDLARKQNRH
jgi:hypothetical protein